MGIEKIGAGLNCKRICELIPIAMAMCNWKLILSIVFLLQLFRVVKVNGALFTDIGNVWFLKKAIGRSSMKKFLILAGLEKILPLAPVQASGLILVFLLSVLIILIK